MMKLGSCPKDAMYAIFIRYVVVPEHCEQLRVVVGTDQMVKDHLPWRYQCALRDLLLSFHTSGHVNVKIAEKEE